MSAATACSALYYHADYRQVEASTCAAAAIVSGDKFRREPEERTDDIEGRGDDMIKSGGIYVSPTRGGGDT